MFKKAIFWFLLLIVLLLLTGFALDDVAIDINLHDTYFVVGYFYAILPVLVVFVLIIGGYWMLGMLQLQLNAVFKWSHIVISYLTIFVYLIQAFGPYMGIEIFPRRYYVSDEPLPNYEAQIAAVSFLVFLTFQLTFFIMVGAKVIRKAWGSGN